MIRTGDTIENPVTGEVLRFLQTSADTNGEAVVVEATIRPDGFVAAPHVHPYQSERFEIVEGTVGFRRGREELVATAGNVVVVEAGTPHTFWNAGDTDARFVTTVSPALAFESLIETMFSLAADGRTNRKGMPNPLRLAVIANAHFDVVRLPVVPQPLQRLALACGAPVGRLFGYGPTYAPAEAAPAGSALATV
jgi:mannose-6-phosphate isomerase-like protein (cupin superfamily)